MPFLNSRTLADRWSMDRRTIDNWRWSGRGPQFVKLGGCARYRLEDVEAFEAERLQQSTSTTYNPKLAKKGS